MLSRCKPPNVPRAKTLNAKHQRSSSESLASAECMTVEGNKQMSFFFGL